MYQGHYNIFCSLVRLLEVPDYVLEAAVKLLTAVVNNEPDGSFALTRISISFDDDRNILYAWNQEADMVVWDWKAKKAVVYHEYWNYKVHDLYSELLDNLTPSTYIESDDFFSLDDEEE